MSGGYNNRVNKPPRPLFEAEAPRPSAPSAPATPPRPLFAPETPAPRAAEEPARPPDAQPPPPPPRAVFAPETPGTAPEAPAGPPAALFGDGVALPPDFAALAAPALADLPPGARREARRIAAELLALPLTDARPFMAFGTEAQARTAAVPDALLDLVRERQDEVSLRLGRIRDAIRSVGADDLLPTNLGAAILRRILPPAERLDNAVALVTAEMAGVERDLPKLEERLAKADALLAQEEAARGALHAHCAAGELVRRHLRSRPAPRGAADAGSPAGWCLRSREDRVASLRLSRLGSAGDEQQLRNLRDRYAQLAEAARGGVRDLVALWKRQCSAALIRLRARDGAALGRAVGDLVATGGRLAAAIDAAVGADG